MANTKDPLDPKQIDKLTHKIEALNENIASLDTRVAASVKTQRPVPTFMRGIIGALGAVIGATLVFALIVYILQALAGVPFIGHWFDSLVNQITQERSPIL